MALEKHGELVHCIVGNHPLLLRCVDLSDSAQPFHHLKLLLMCCPAEYHSLGMG